MKRLVLVGFLALALAAATTVYAAHPTFVNESDLAYFSKAPSQSTQGEYQIASRWCRCCWNTRHGWTKCRHMPAWKCQRIGGWCQW